MLTSIGFDPGTKQCGAAFTEGGKVTAVMVVALKKSRKNDGWKMPALVTDMILKLRPVNAFVVENQQVYGKGKADPNDLIRLSHVAGAAAGAAAFRAEKVLFPRPSAWKAGVPKGAHQARILDRLGWSYDFDGPKRPVKNVKIPEDVDKAGPINNATISEIVDAIGLALWGYDRVVSQTK